MRSESSSDIKYCVSLNTYYCDCPARLSTCKHILGLQLIVKEFFTPSYVSLARMKSMNNVGYCDSGELSPLLEEAIHEVNLYENDRRSEFVRQLHNLSRQLKELISHVESSTGDYTVEEVDQKGDVFQMCLTSFSQPFKFQRPSTIDLPHHGSIAPL